MKEPNQDNERLSELLDGRVQGPQREELLAHLSANDDDYAVFADTASLLRALEEEDAGAAGAAPKEEDAPTVAGAPDGVIPLREPQRQRRVPPRWLLPMAASIAAVALVSTFALRTRGSAVEPVQLAARVEAGGVPRDWAARSPWPAGRGRGGGAAPRDATRAGAMLMNLAVAAQAGDSTSTHTLAVQLSELYELGTSAGTPLRRIANRPAAPPDSLAALIDQAWDGLARSLDRKWLELGAWTEAARLAAEVENEEFFRDRTTRGMLRRAQRFADDDAAVTAVRAALPANGPPRWDELKGSLGALAIAIAS